MTGPGRRYEVPFVLRHHEVPRPDGPVRLEIDVAALLRAAGAQGRLDVDSLRVYDLDLLREGDPDPVGRSCVVQPLPGHTGADGEHVQLLFALRKQPWADADFPRHYRLAFDTVRGGGSEPWVPTSTEALTGAPFVPVGLSAAPGDVGIDHAGGRRALGFRIPTGRKPGFHPLTTPSGAVVTQDRPLDHGWHRGLWFAWTLLESTRTPVRRNTFWIEPRMGLVVDHGLTHLVSGPLLTGFTSSTQWCTQEGRPVLDCRITAGFQPVPDAWNWLDLTLELSAASEPVRVATEYGHLAARAPVDLLDAYVLDSAAAEPLPGTARDEVEIRWAGFGGTVAGRPVSLLLLDAPGNPGGRPHRDVFFERWQFPLGEGNLFLKLCLDPIRDQPLVIEPGAPLTWRYRVVTADRPLTRDFAEYQYGHWAVPLTVEGPF